MTIQGLSSPVTVSWVEDGDAGGRFSLLFCVSHKTFTEQGSKLSPGEEKVLSLYHIMHLSLWPGCKADTHLTTNMNIIFFLHFIWDFCDSEPACQIGRCVRVELDTGHFL